MDYWNESTIMNEFSSLVEQLPGLEAKEKAGKAPGWNAT